MAVGSRLLEQGRFELCRRLLDLGVVTVRSVRAIGNVRMRIAATPTLTFVGVLATLFMLAFVLTAAGSQSQHSLDYVKLRLAQERVAQVAVNVTEKTMRVTEAGARPSVYSVRFNDVDGLRKLLERYPAVGVIWTSRSAPSWVTLVPAMLAVLVAGGVVLVLLLMVKRHLRVSHQ